MGRLGFIVTWVTGLVKGIYGLPPVAKKHHDKQNLTCVYNGKACGKKWQKELIKKLAFRQGLISHGEQTAIFKRQTRYLKFTMRTKPPLFIGVHSCIPNRPTAGSFIWNWWSKGQGGLVITTIGRMWKRHNIKIYIDYKFILQQTHVCGWYTQFIFAPQFLYYLDYLIAHPYTAAGQENSFANADLPKMIMSVF